jgi:gliding motility-associated-like protein
MKTSILRLLLLLFFFTKGLTAYASHIFGGELLYSHITGNKYKITLTIYGDCGAPSGIFSTLYTSDPLVLIYNGTMPHDSIRLEHELIGVEVSPVCAALIKSTSCNGGSLPGVKKFVYSDTVDLPAVSSNWRFIFNGNMGVSFTGRSDNITNINNLGGGSVMQLETKLNNTIAPNSSPLYSSVPTPYYCLDMESEYNQGAIDPDGDSLAFSMVPGIEGNTGGNVAYVPPFSGANPLSTAAGDFIFNPLNGQVTFKPNTIQNSLVVNQVSEYRGGVLVGISRREMTFIVTQNCDMDPPSINITGVSGGTLSGKNVINVCVGTPHLSFSIGLSNPSGDSATFSVSSVPATAALNIYNNNTPNPSGSFSWNTASLPTGVYTFYLTVKNNHCPIAFRQTVAYTINVVPMPKVSAAVISPTQCVHQGYVQYNLTDGYLPRKVDVKQGTVVVKTYIDNTGIITDSLPTGDYIVEVSCNPLCKATTALAVADNGTLPLLPVTESLCKGDPQEQLAVSPAGSGATFKWYDSNDNELAEAPTPNTSVPGSYLWYVVQQYKVCVSDKVPVKAIVHELPVPQITSKPTQICYGDSILLTATGGVSYIWTPEELVATNPEGQPVARMTVPVTLTVKATDENGCGDTASISYDNIEKCCGFVYPTAFTPNKDGRNDGFRVLTKGNMMYYLLVIYNRWGERVFITSDPRQYWYGDQNGVPCEMGTYFYYFKAKCLTGPVEEHKGDVTLIR